MKINLQLVTPEKTLLNEEVDSVTCTTTMGQITILPGHLPLVATLVSGEFITRSLGQERVIHVAGGFVQVQGENKVVILADSAEHTHEIDVAEAERAARAAQETLANVTPGDELYAKAVASLELHTSRLRVARKHAHTRNTPITSEGVLGE